jgi:hypothetical protein
MTRLIVPNLKLPTKRFRIQSGSKSSTGASALARFLPDLRLLRSEGLSESLTICLWVESTVKQTEKLQKMAQKAVG